MTKRQSISIRAFAKQIHVSEGAIRKAVKEGKFKVGYDPALKKIDPVAAAADTWVQKQYVPVAKAGVSRQHAIDKINRQNKKTEEEKEYRPPGPQFDEEDIEDMLTEEEDTSTLLERIKVTSRMGVDVAMKYREIVALAADKKKLEELNGTLVRKDKVEKALYAVGGELKKALMNIPQKIVRSIMDAASEVDGITALTIAITEVLQDYGNLKPNSLK